MGDLRAQTIPLDELHPNDAQQMYALFESYYDATSQENFKQDLEAKDYVVLLRDEKDCIRGFSTVAVIESNFNGRRIRAIFSGDTIIQHEFWGEQTLPQAWCRLAGQIKAQDPTTPLYWYLIVKGQKTFRYMTLFSHNYYPSWKHETPAYEKELMDTLGEMKFGKYYDSKTGLIRFPKSHGHLKKDFAEIRQGFSLKPDIKFFLDKNPRYYEGEELLCLTELCEDNMRSIAQRSFLAGLNESLDKSYILQPSRRENRLVRAFVPNEATL